MKGDTMEWILTMFLCCALFWRVNSAYEVQLNGGDGQCQGKVKVRRSSTDTWGEICDKNFRQSEANVVCNQLNFRYARLETGIYKPEYSGAFALDNVRCDGTEKNIEQCQHKEWNEHECFSNNDLAAGVCCSNSSIFGDIQDDVFTSHCGGSWLEAQTDCETRGSTLVFTSEYTNVLNHLKTNVPTVSNRSSLWTAGFFSPWIWANGCVTMKEGTVFRYRFTVDNNSPQICVQHCILHSDSFMLSGSLCQCVNQTDVTRLTQSQLPAHCKVFCTGDRSRFCGTGTGDYWNIYTITADRDFFRITDPGSYDVNQCAVIDKSRRLESQGCNANRAYICHEVTDVSDADDDDNDDDNKIKMMRFNDKTGQDNARKQCPSKATSLQLIGDKILAADDFYFEYAGLWIDLARTRTDVATGLSSTTLQKLNPTWCFSFAVNGSNAITRCDRRYLYTCVKEHMSTTPVSSGTNSSSGGSETESEMLHLVLIIACSIAVSLFILAALIFWIKRRSGDGITTCCFRDSNIEGGRGASATTTNEYSATYHAGETDDHNYEELKGTRDNVYSEIDTLLEERNTDRAKLDNDANDITGTVGMKEPLQMTKSYSNPKDMLLPNGNTRDSAKYFMDDSYTYPYDKVYRPEEDNAAAKTDNLLATKKVIDDSIKEIVQNGSSNSIGNMHVVGHGISDKISRDTINIKNVSCNISRQTEPMNTNNDTKDNDCLTKENLNKVDDTGGDQEYNNKQYHVLERDTSIPGINIKETDVIHVIHESNVYNVLGENMANKNDARDTSVYNVLQRTEDLLSDSVDIADNYADPVYHVLEKDSIGENEDTSQIQDDVDKECSVNVIDYETGNERFDTCSDSEASIEIELRPKADRGNDTTSHERVRKSRDSNFSEEMSFIEDRDSYQRNSAS